VSTLRNTEHEFTAAARSLTAHFDSAVVQGDDLLHHGQPDAEPRATLAVAGICLGEDFENPGQQFGADSLASVLHSANEM
jgi:hypothetical protein